MFACMSARSIDRVCLFVAPWTAARQASLSMGFSREEYWGGLPCPPSGDLPNSGMEPADSLPLSYLGSLGTLGTCYYPVQFLSSTLRGIPHVIMNYVLIQTLVSSLGGSVTMGKLFYISCLDFFACKMGLTLVLTL